MNLNLMATFFPSGGGIAGYHVFKALYDLGVNIALLRMGDKCVPWADAEAMMAAQRNILRFDCHAPCLKIWHQFGLAERIGKGPFLPYVFFELDPLAPRDVHHLNSSDRVVVGSAWAKGVCERSGVTVPVSVVPLGVDASVFFPAPERRDGPCVFLNVGKWEARKGHDVLIEAFNAAFDETDNVELWVMPNHYQMPAEQQQRWWTLYKGSKMGRAGKVKIGSPVATHLELADLMRKATCGVFPARAEGFNLELLEMMACGKPVITTNYSAHTEYCHANNALLIEGAGLEHAYDGVYFKGTGHGSWLAWGPAQSEQLRAHLRCAYAQFRAGESFNQGGLDTARLLSWDHTARSLLDVLQHTVKMG